MKNQKVVLVIDTLLKLAVIIALVIAVETKQQYSYFTFLRWLVMATFIYFAYKAYDKKQIGLLIYYGIVAVLFNPVHKFWFQKETWHLINYLVAVITLGNLIFDWTQKEKNNEINIETKNIIMKTKTKIIISKEIVINLKLILVSIGITIIAFCIFYFALKPNKTDIQNKIKQEQALRADSNAKATIIADSIAKLNKLRILYDEESKKYDIGSFIEFSKKMWLPEKRKIFFNECNKDLGFKDYNEFEELCGFKDNKSKVSILTKSYKIGKDIYFIPIDQINELNKEHPDAIEIKSFINKKDTFDIPINKIIEFKKKYPNSQPLIKVRNYLKNTNDNIKDFYRNVVDKKVFANENEFKNFILNREKVKQYYQIDVPKGMFKDENEFFDYLGLKKEEQLAFVLDSNVVINTEYEHRMIIFKEDIIRKTLLTFYISLIVLIVGRYLFKLAMIAGRAIYMLLKAIKKYSKMDINQK